MYKLHVHRNSQQDSSYVATYFIPNNNKNNKRESTLALDFE